MRSHSIVLGSPTWPTAATNRMCPDRSAWALVQSDGKPLARIGRFGNYDGQFEMAHSIAVDAEGSVYVRDITGARVRTFVRAAISSTH